MAFSISNSCSTYLPSFLSPCTWAEKWKEYRNRNEVEEVTKKIANECLTEVGIVFSYLCISSLFISSLSFAAYLVCLSIATVAINALIRYASKASFVKGKEQEAHYVYRWLSLSFCFLDRNIRQTLVHEMGHAFFGFLLFKGIPEISIYSGGGDTSCDTSLSYLGTLIGEKNALTLFHIGGPLFDLLEILLFVLVAHYLKESHPQIAQYLHMFALVNVWNNVYYSLDALSALFSEEDPSAHDFVGLWKLGIHPIASASLFIFLPLYLKDILTEFEEEKDASKKIRDQSIISPLQSLLLFFLSQKL